MSKLKITKIELTTKDGKVVDLTLEEARDLHAQLAELFGSKTTYVSGNPIYIPYNPLPYRGLYWYGVSGTASNLGDTYCVSANLGSGLTANFTGTLEA